MLEGEESKEKIEQSEGYQEWDCLLNYRPSSKIFEQRVEGGGGIRQ